MENESLINWVPDGPGATLRSQLLIIDKVLVIVYHRLHDKISRRFSLLLQESVGKHEHCFKVRSGKCANQLGLHSFWGQKASTMQSFLLLYKFSNSVNNVTFVLYPYRRLRIGYSTEDTLFPIHPGLRRAVLEAKKVLETQGHIVVEFPLPNPTRVSQMYSGFVYADNLKVRLYYFLTTKIFNIIT